MVVKQCLKVDVLLNAARCRSVFNSPLVSPRYYSGRMPELLCLMLTSEFRLRTQEIKKGQRELHFVILPVAPS